MTTIRILILAITLLPVWTGCEKSSEPKAEPPLTQDGLIPFRIGGSWTYTVTQYDSNGAVLGPSPPGTNEIRYSTVISGERWFMFSHGSDYLPRTNRPDGVWTRWSTTNVGLEFTTRFGDSCLTTRSGSHVALVDIDSVITVPAGTFTCFRYRELFPPFPYSEWDYFIAPGIGIIREDFYIRYNNGRWFMEAQSVLDARTP